MTEQVPSKEQVAEFSLVDQMRASINTLHAYHLPLTGDLMSTAAEEIERLRFELTELAGQNEVLDVCLHETSGRVKTQMAANVRLANENTELRRDLDAALEREKALAARCKWYADSQEALRSRVCRQNDIDERGGA